jgi:transcription elongation factor GreA
MQRCPMTPKGYSALEKELKYLKEVIRPEVVKQIEIARAHGDLSENAEYDAAKDRQGMTEARLRHVETQLATAEIIDVATLPESDLVVFGSTIKLFDTDTDEEFSYRLVGREEANVKNGDVSFDSPVGRALLGKHEGDEVKVKAPKGTRTLEILEIRYV